MGELVNFMQVIISLILQQVELLEKAELDRMHVEGRVALLRIAAARAEASIALAKLAAAMRAAGCSEEMVEEHLEQSWLHGSKAVDAVGVQEPEGLWKHI